MDNTPALSNHMHNLVAAREGDPRDISASIGFIKREVGRRWSHQVNWNPCG